MDRLAQDNIMRKYNRNPHIVDAVQVPNLEASIEEFASFIKDLQTMFKSVVYGWEINDNNFVSVRCLNASGINTSVGPGGWIIKSGTFGEKLTAVENVKFRKDYTSAKERYTTHKGN